VRADILHITVLSLVEVKVSICEEKCPHTDLFRYQPLDPVDENSASYPKTTRSPVYTCLDAKSDATAHCIYPH
jgi:hypothetical protein